MGGDAWNLEVWTDVWSGKVPESKVESWLPSVCFLSYLVYVIHQKGGMRLEGSKRCGPRAAQQNPTERISLLELLPPTPLQLNPLYLHFHLQILPELSFLFKYRFIPHSSV